MNHIPRNRDSFIDQLNPFINRIFQHAVMQGDMAIVSLMLKHGVVVRRNERNRFGLTALQQSVLDGNCRLVVRLLESGADLEAKTSNGWTSLHIASAAGNINMVHLLLSNCADVVALTKNEELPIDVASSKDMKVVLANHMSRCGYIELSQWYMGQITPLDTGVVYLMSADSLLQIACDSPESYPTDGYGYYTSNVMPSYSSMVNLQSGSFSEPCIALQSKPRIRKGSVWSLSQQYTNGTQEATTKRLDNDYNGQPDTSWANNRNHASRSLSSGCLIDTVEPFLERVEEQAPMATYAEAGLSSQDCDNIQESLYRQSVYVTNVTETGTMRRIKRKMSSRRKISESGMQFQNDWEGESAAPVFVSIDYYQESINIQDEDEDIYEDEYLQFESDRRGRQNSTASSSSVDYGESLQAFNDGAVVEHENTDSSNSISRDRTLLDEFAENCLALARYETENGSTSGQFEIDTDNMDDILSEHGESDEELQRLECGSEDESISEGDIEDCESQEKNMYFNPMYRSADVLYKDSLQNNTMCAFPDYKDQKRQQQLLKDQILLNNSYSRNDRCGSNVGSKERKRKKRGLISGLVSKFKGTVKLHRTSSDTNLHSPDDNLIQKRDNRKVKTLRRRRHVRRSNSFSSYFPPVLEQVNGKGEFTKNACNSNCHNSKDPNSASPYSPHGKDRSPLKSPHLPANQQPMKQNAQLVRESSLPRDGRDSQGGHPMTFKGSQKLLEKGNCQPNLNGNVNLGINGNANYIDLTENVGSRIPVMSVNTYTKGAN